MSTILVRRHDVMPAVHSTDSNLHEILTQWFRDAGGPEDQFEAFLKSFDEAIAQHEHKPWLVNAETGIQFVPPATFLTMFEEIGDTDVLGEIYAERMTHAKRGYDAVHDDSNTTAHLLNGVIFRVGPLANVTNTLPDEVKRHELIQAASLILAAIDKIDRSQQVTTFSVD